MLHLITERQMKTDLSGTMITLSAGAAVEQPERSSAAAGEGSVFCGTSTLGNNLAALTQLNLCVPGDAQLRS